MLEIPVRIENNLYSSVFGMPTAQFFAYPELWERLRNEIIPEIVCGQPDGTILKAWVTECSTGQEAYSLAIIWKEVIDELRPNSGISLKITGSDIHENRIEFAKKGIYFNQVPNEISEEVSEERIHRFFNKGNGESWEVNDEIKRMVEFKVHNAVTDPPFTGNHFLSSLYLCAWLHGEAQGKLFRNFFDSMVPGGVYWDSIRILYRRENWIDH